MKKTAAPLVGSYAKCGHITTQRISPASAGGGFYLTKQSEYNLRLFGQRFYESPLLVKSRALNFLQVFDVLKDVEYLFFDN